MRLFRRSCFRLCSGCSAVLLLGLFLLGSVLQGQTAYFWGSWHDPDPSIQTADSAGQNITTILDNPSGDVFELDYNPNNMKLYGAAAIEGQVFSIDTDGSNYTVLSSGQNRPAGIALDLSGGKIYWTSASGGFISRSNLDGSSAETLVTGLTAPYGLDIDLINNKIYWIENSVRVARSNLDGSSVEGIITSGIGGSDWGLALNPSAGKMYWSQSNTIRRANLDGSSSEVFVASPAVGTLYVLEYQDELDRLYWSDYGPTSRLSGINEDGTGQTVYVTAPGTTSMSGIVPIPEPSTYTLILAAGVFAFILGRKVLGKKSTTA